MPLSCVLLAGLGARSVQCSMPSRGGALCEAQGSTARNRAGDKAVIIQPNFLAQTAAIVALAAKHRLPILSSYRDTTRAGGLIFYSADHAAPARSPGAEVNQFTRLPRASANPTIRAIAVSSIKDRVAPEDPSRPNSSGCRG
jgi:hypothetical protein